MIVAKTCKHYKSFAYIQRSNLHVARNFWALGPDEAKLPDISSYIGPWTELIYRVPSLMEALPLTEMTWPGRSGQGERLR